MPLVQYEDDPGIRLRDGRSPHMVGRTKTILVACMSSDIRPTSVTVVLVRVPRITLLTTKIGDSEATYASNLNL